MIMKKFFDNIKNGIEDIFDTFGYMGEGFTNCKVDYRLPKFYKTKSNKKLGQYMIQNFYHKLNKKCP
jgi:hypothetical protein